jgi:Mrp family chromosome partitioning ATPase
LDSSEPNLATLTDLLRPIRVRAWLIIALVGLAVAVSLALSLSEAKKYSATGAYQFQDQTQALDLAGLAPPTATTLAPAQLASQSAQTIHQPNVVSRARALLTPSLRNLNFNQAVTATVDPNSNNVDVQATASTPTGAAAVANAFVNAAVAVANETLRMEYATDAAQLSRQRVPKAEATAVALRQEEVARLQTLAQIATRAQVATRSTPPGSPSSPRPLRNAALAGILGLMVGLVAVYVWDALDQRLRRVDDVTAHFGYPLLGRVRDGALGNSPNSGDPERAIEPIDWEQFLIVMRNLSFLRPSRSLQTVAVTSTIPEEGKTTVACFVGFAAAATGRRTLLIECDLRHPVMAKRLGLKSSPGVTDLVEGSVTLSEVLQVINFNDPVVSNGAVPLTAGQKDNGVLPRHQLACITAGTQTRRAVEILESPALTAMLDEVRGIYDAVILDTPPLLPVIDALDIVDKAETVIVCGRADRLTRSQARAGKQALERLPDRLVGLVVTGIKPSRDDQSYGYSYYDSYAGSV